MGFLFVLSVKVSYCAHTSQSFRQLIISIGSTQRGIQAHHKMRKDRVAIGTLGVNASHRGILLTITDIRRSLC